MKILSIGNSFSQDAQSALYTLALAAGLHIKTANLVIGGCTLARHYRNMLSGKDAYSFELNGASSGLTVSLDQVLLSDDWDIVTVQQMSSDAAHYETYQPYLKALVDYVRECAPKAEVVIHQTWCYEAGSEKLAATGYPTPADMFCDIRASYETAARDVEIKRIIPSGELMYRAQEAGFPNVYRDTFHAGHALGRYMISALWLRCLCGVKADHTRGGREPLAYFDDEDVLAKADALIEEVAASYGF